MMFALESESGANIFSHSLSLNEKCRETPLVAFSPHVKKKLLAFTKIFPDSDNWDSVAFERFL